MKSHVLAWRKSPSGFHIEYLPTSGVFFEPHRGPSTSPESATRISSLALLSFAGPLDIAEPDDEGKNPNVEARGRRCQGNDCRGCDCRVWGPADDSSELAPAAP
jgi:hypothetical protein